MVNPAPLPTTPKVEDWERLRADFIAQEMAPSADNPRGLTPSEATPQGHARASDLFATMFPGRKFPVAIAPAAQSVRTEPLPGGVKTHDGRTWMPVAKVEDDRSSIRPSERIGARELSDMTQVYDPQNYRATVITPQGGDVHLTGETASAEAGTAGHIDALDFDGHMMWGLAAQVNGGIDKAVANGLHNRSIGSWIQRREAGNRPYLRHLGLTAEAPGQWNLGAITKYYPGTSATTRTTSDGEMRFRTLADLPELDQQRSRTMPEKNPETDAPEIDYDQIATRVADKLKAATAKPAEPAKAPDFEEMIYRAITAATKPLTDQVAELKTRVAESATAAAKSAADARNTRVRTTLDECVRSGQILPAQSAQYEKMLTLPELGEATVEEQLTAIRALPVVPLSRARTMVQIDEQTSVPIPGEFEPLPGYNVDGEGVAAVMRARTAAAKETDPDKAYAVLAREIYRQAGEPIPAHLN